MSYGRLLNKMILDKGYTYKEFLEECSKNGKKIDKGNFSKIINDKTTPPKENISRMFAKICGADERLLVLEGYIATAPKEIKDFFVSMKMSETLIAMNLFENKIEPQFIEEMKRMFEKEPIANFIVDVIDNNISKINYTDTSMELSNLYNDKVSIVFNEPLTVQIYDNSMFPKIMENSKIQLKIQDKYKNGDILAIKIKGQDNYVIRYTLFNNDTVTLMPINNKFETLDYNLKDIIILGKVTKVITNI